jgi:type VI secretion system protein VasG
MEHWIRKMAEAPDGDIARIVRHFEIQPDRFLQEIAQALAGFKTGSGSRPNLTQSIEEIAREGWLLASVNYQVATARTGVLFLAVLRTPVLQRRLAEISPEAGRISADELARQLPDLVAGAPEDREVLAASSGPAERGLSGAAGGGKPGAGGPTPALDQYTVDLTGQAKAGRIDPVLGRDPEIRQIIDILMRRRQNNPILTGEAGVGKTAVVEGFAKRIAEGDVPEPLQNVDVRTLDLGLLQAGAGVKGEFENRLKQVIEEVRGSARPIILFIDEAHTMIGAGGAAGQNDAANLLKPALARGELRTVAATTWAEYKKYFEKDPALTRRFQVVKIEEPDEESGIAIMRGVAPKLEEHHRVRILDEAVQDSVRLSLRYLPARQLPDKSVSVLDTACARVSIGQGAIPAPIEDLRRRLQVLEREHLALRRESAVGALHEERLAEIEAQRVTAAADLKGLEERWEKEKALVEEISGLRDRLQAGVNGAAPSNGDAPAAETGAAEAGKGAESGKAEKAGNDAAAKQAATEAAEGEAEAPAALSDADRTKLRGELDAKRAELQGLQGENPLVAPEVNAQTVAEVISGWTGIPVGRMVADQIRTVLNLEEHLKERVKGQDHGLSEIASRIRTSRAKMDDPNKPIGVFLLVGPSGVGKTETALTLAESLYGGERNLITINMSEYQEAHTVSSLKGSPPGYVGYGEGGVLTEAVRRRPYSVVLLDEVEKAHPDVMELFFQVFDKGTLEDGEGRVIDFKNTIILLTSNIGSDTIMKLSADPDTAPDPGPLADAIRPELVAHFPAALLGRMIVVPYFPLYGEILRQIIHLKLGRIVRRVRANHGAELACGDDVVQLVLDRCTESESGARNIDAILTRTLLPAVSAEILDRMASGAEFKRVAVKVSGGDFTYEIE